MHRLLRGLVAASSAVALAVASPAAATPAHAAASPTLTAEVTGAGVAQVVLTSTGDAPISDCFVWLSDDEWNHIETLGRDVTLNADTSVQFLGTVELARGFYFATARCAEGRARVGLTAKTSPFTDVPWGMQFYTEIMWMSAENVSTGWPDGSYRPLEPIQRDAMAAFLYRMAGSPDVTLPDESPFSDVTPSTMFYREIVWLAQTGITRGHRDGTFRPLDPVNRDAMAAFLFRYFHEVAYPDQFEWVAPEVSPFTDVATTDEFFTEIAWLADTEISFGYSDHTYRPVTPVLRDAMAAFLFRMHWLILSSRPVETSIPTGPVTADDVRITTPVR